MPWYTGNHAHRAVSGDGAVAGRKVLVHGVLGSVSSLAAQLATWAGAEVIGTVTREKDLDHVDTASVAHPVALDRGDAVEQIRRHAPDGVDRIVEVAFSDNVDLDAAVAANDAVIAAYASRADRPEIPFWPLLFANVAIRLLGSDDFSAQAKAQAATDLTTAASQGALRIPAGAVYPLSDIAAAHEHVDHGPRNGRILVRLDS
jgi:NADPH2:quinone reductase